MGLCDRMLLVELRKWVPVTDGYLIGNLVHDFVNQVEYLVILYIMGGQFIKIYFKLAQLASIARCPLL